MTKIGGNDIRLPIHSAAPIHLDDCGYAADVDLMDNSSS